MIWWKSIKINRVKKELNPSVSNLQFDYRTICKPNPLILENNFILKTVILIKIRQRIVWSFKIKRF